MDETILPSSPNWFQVTGIAVSCDNWIFYGGPSKALCVLEPIPSNIIDEEINYTSHTVSRAHPEKITSLDISPEWPTKKTIISGSADGLVKEWKLFYEEEKLVIKSSHFHEAHKKNNEEVIGVGYSSETYAITVGNFGNVVLWDYHSNIVKSNTYFLKSFKPTAMACSKHLPLHVAVGTKQGVLLCLDLNEPAHIVYKVRAHDYEITSMSWCPQYEVEMRKLMKESVSSRMQRIRNESEPECKEIVQENIAISSQTDKEQITSTSQTDKGQIASTSHSDKEKITYIKLDTNNQDAKSESEATKTADDLELSLNKLSLNKSEIEQEDLFDMYKDHAADEFGHKKYQPEEIRVKVEKTAEDTNDFLAECVKLKQDLLWRKKQSEESIESLVESFDKTTIKQNQQGKTIVPSSVHIHKHMLATIGKQGAVHIWSKSGKLVSSGSVANACNQQKNKCIGWMTLLWQQPNVLLIVDGKCQLLKCNPLVVDYKNKLDHHILHTLHRRGMFSITSTAPRVQSKDTEPQDWVVWTAAQDRYLIAYSLERRRMIRSYGTCSGFIYDIATCPYDPNKLAISVGDGTLRVWNQETADDDTKLKSGNVVSYWQNVQGKVLVSAWHPTKENLLAFATAEARVGVIDTSSRTEKPAKVLPSVLRSAVYGLCWGEGYNLYACGAGELFMYKANKIGEAPLHILVELEGKKWELSDVYWHERALIVGSLDGAVGLLTPTYPHTIVTIAFPFSKTIHNVDWHPQQVTTSDEESPNKNMIAVCSIEKPADVVVMELTETEDGSIKLLVKKKLSGHKGPVFQVAWNPHKEAYLLSSSKDGTIRVWDVAEEVCVSIFGGHGDQSRAALCAVWGGREAHATFVISGGSDNSLRLWDYTAHPAELYTEHEHGATRRKFRTRTKPGAATNEDNPELQDQGREAIKLEIKVKASKKFLLSLTNKQILTDPVNACRKILKKYLESKSQPDGNGDVTKDKGLEAGSSESGTDVGEGDTSKNDDDIDCDFIKLFGTMNELNELLDIEAERHIEMGNDHHWVMLSIFRGNIDAAFQFAAQKDMLTPYLLSLAPCVSFKYWKDATQLYLTQIDRLAVSGKFDQFIADCPGYGGPVYMKAATLLSIHDLKSAIAVLIQGRLFKEAYMLCRVRYMDSIAQDILKAWAKDNDKEYRLVIAAICYIALGDLTAAASALAKSNNEEHLSLSSEIYQLCGQVTYAENSKLRSEILKSSKTSEDDNLVPLPSKVDVMMDHVKV